METRLALRRVAPRAPAQTHALAACVPAYLQYLVDRGYADHTRHAYVRCVVHLGRWLTQRRRAVRDLTPRDIARFLDEHVPRCTCAPPMTRCRHQLRAALRHLLAALHDAGIVTTPRLTHAVDEELCRFDMHLQHAQGLATTTRVQRLRILRSFLSERRGDDAGPLPPLDADCIRRFLVERLPRWSPASSKVLASTLRSYVRFRIGCGDPVRHLLPVIASPAHWRLAPLPETLSPTEVTRLLADRSPQVGTARRAHAMIRLVVDLGLRSREVVGLALDDIDWRAGTIRIRQSKSRRVDVLPLPAATACAIAEYLQAERPRRRNRRVFVRHVAPVDAPIGPDAVRHAVRDAYRRCGMPHTRVHILRHTLAGRLLASGGTLKEVADVLRHRDLDTSLIYAKIDTARLAAVALGWPGSVP